MHSAPQGAGDGGVCVGVPATHDGINDSLLKAGGTKKLPQSILECDENPALLTDVVRRWSRRRINDYLHQWSLDLHLRCPFLDLVVDFLSPFSRADCIGD